MRQKTLGTQGLAVSEMGFGAMGISAFYGPSDAQGGTAAIKRAHELGVTLFDTAESYAWGENERVLGRAVAGFRDEVVIATKFGYTHDFGFDSRPEHIREVARASLKNLGVETIDVLFQHRIDPEVPIEEVAGTVRELIDAGQVRYFGLSEVGPETIRRAHAIQPVSVLQTEYSVFERGVERLFPVLEELGIGLISYSPLGRGFITGGAKPAAEYDEDDFRRTNPRWQPGNYEKNVEAVSRLTELAAAKGATVSQLALAWVVGRGEHIVPIPGTRSAHRVEENIGALDLQLTEADLAAIREILPNGSFGPRYLESGMPEWV